MIGHGRSATSLGKQDFDARSYNCDNRDNRVITGMKTIIKRVITVITGTISLYTNTLGGLFLYKKK